MRIVLIAPGYESLPPKGWGAVESIVWDYYENLKKKGIDVYIVNTSDFNNIILQCNKLKPDIVHIMYDDYVNVAPQLRCNKIYYTSHYAYITHPNFEKQFSGYFQIKFKKVIECHKYIFINAISEDIKNVYIRYGFPSNKINVVCNGARDDLFQYKEIPEKGDHSIYIAKIEARKSQYKYQHIPNIHFVGNYQDSTFNIKNKNYIGEWSKPFLYKNLTNYANLVLLSEGEADPLVVKEALIAGLGLVVNRISAANLDLTKPFITIIPDEKLNDIIYIEEKIKENREISLSHRNEIRQYALENFAWSIIVDKYIELIKK